VPYGGPYYVFTVGIRIRYDIRVLAAEADTEEADVVSTRRNYPSIQR